MQPPCEVMANEFLPNMRGLVSHDLHESGESQRKIAVLLGITQARVSYYLAKKKGMFSNELCEKFGLSQSDVQSYSRILAEDVKRSQVDGIFTLYSIWKNLLFSGAICTFHQRNSNIQSDCAVCMELHKPARDSSPTSDKEVEDNSTLREISDAISLIENSPHFPSIMPEVSVNVAMSRKEPKSTRDVAAIPGRINRIYNRAKSFVLPEFGCSNHMSQVLLIFHSKNKDLRAALNIKYDDGIEKTLGDLEIPKTFTTSPAGKGAHGVYDAKSRDDPVLQRLTDVKMSQDKKAQVFAIIDKGSEGVEPITYLLGKKATDLAQVAIKIAHAYAALRARS